MWLGKHKSPGDVGFSMGILEYLGYLPYMVSKSQVDMIWIGLICIIYIYIYLCIYLGMICPCYPFGRINNHELGIAPVTNHGLRSETGL